MTPYPADATVIEGKTLLLTGGTGSFGQKFVEIALKLNPRAIRVFSRGELLQVEMARKFQDDRLRFFIGDVRDKERVSRAMERVDIVVHAAALKHIPVTAYNPRECILTNIVGSQNVVDCAIDCGIQKCVLISTDKAAHPSTLYGASKLVAESVFVQGNVYGKTRFSVVRYGNVVSSRGSLVSLLGEQIKKGYVTITDPRMTRFWLTVSQGTDLVLLALDMMLGGEVFIPKVSSMKVVDLVEAVAPGTEKRVIGIRPGEKLHETLITEDEARHTKEFDNFFIIEPEFSFWNKDSFFGGKQVSDGFVYSSDQNKQWISAEEIVKMVQS